jgi:hypothetical protein
LASNKSYSEYHILMPIAQSKRKLIAAAALFVTFGALMGAIATGGEAATIAFAQEPGQTTTPPLPQQEGGDVQVQEEIVLQGTVTSEPDPVPGHEQHDRAEILPLRQDGSVYVGTLTFTASEPVDVVLLNIQNLNDTEQQTINATTDDFGTLLTALLPDGTNIAINLITPDYGTTAVPTTSLPFVGNGLWLHTTTGEPFIANYAVYARVLPAGTANTISELPETPDAATAEEEEEEEAVTTPGGEDTEVTQEDGEVSAANMTATATDATDTNATATEAATAAEQEGEEQQQQTTPTIPAPNPLFE